MGGGRAAAAGSKGMPPCGVERELRLARGTAMASVGCASLEESGGGPEREVSQHALRIGDGAETVSCFLHAIRFLVVFPSLLINFFATSNFCLHGILFNIMDTS